MSDGSNGAVSDLLRSANGGGGRAGRPGTPRSASQRGYLRNGLPAVYLDGDFGMRFLFGLEEVLDPIVDTLDSLPFYVDADLAPDHLLGLFSSWLGLLSDEQLAPEVRRALVRNAAELTRRRGTVGGLQLLLDLTFPELGLKVDDEGGVVICDDVPTMPEPGPRKFTVRSPSRLGEEQRAAIIRVIERERPVHVAYELVDSTRSTPLATTGDPT